MRADDAAAEDHDLGRLDAGHAAEQDALAAMRLFEECAPACTAMRPATSLIGASSGRPPFVEVTVS